MKTALITGVTGQDGSYLSELLLEKGYEVHGIIRRSSVDFRERIAHLEGKPHFHLHFADLGDSMSIVKVVDKVRPDEIYNLAAQSHVQVSFDSPEFTADVDATGVLRVLEAVRACHLERSCRFYQASTSELYGKVEAVPQNEDTPFHPYSPYAVAKLYGYWIVREYREAYGMFCCSGILFNHESERRGETLYNAAERSGRDARSSRRLSFFLGTVHPSPARCGPKRRRADIPERERHSGHGILSQAHAPADRIRRPGGCRKLSGRHAALQSGAVAADASLYHARRDFRSLLFAS